MSEQYLLKLIKQAAVDAVQAAKPAEITFGTITGTDPLKIRIDERIEIDEDFIIRTESAADKLNKGDKVVMLRMQGGQKYLFIDRVVE